MADGQTRPPKAPPPPTTAAAPAPQSALEQERDRLANALAQLARSNAELQRELDAARDGGRPLDRDYKEALQDNVVVVARYRARVAALEEEIEKVKRGAAPVVEGAGGGGGGGAFGPPRDAGGLGVGVAPEAAVGAGAGGAGGGRGGAGGTAAMATDANNNNGDDANAGGGGGGSGGGTGDDGVWV